MRRWLALFLSRWHRRKAQRLFAAANDTAAVIVGAIIALIGGVLAVLCIRSARPLPTGSCELPG